MVINYDRFRINHEMYDAYAEMDRKRSIAAAASVLCSAAFVYRPTSLSVICPVIAAISFAEQPASANRLVAAFLNPCVTHRSPRPASAIRSAIQFPKPFGLNGFPKFVVSSATCVFGHSATTRQSSGCNGIQSLVFVLP